MSLRLDWCSHEAAKYAVEKWHYSQRMPAGKIVKIGVWENEMFIGCVLFGRGANPNLGSPYGLIQTEVCELVRIALTTHTAPVSRIVSIAIKMLHKHSPRTRLIVSFADPEQGHHGGVYQAMGWVYKGLSILSGGFEYFINGKWMHTRSLAAKHGTRADAALAMIYPNTAKRRVVQKYTYIYPLDAAMKKQIEPLRQPYPKRLCAASIGGDAFGDQPKEGGAAPTAALHNPLT